MWSLLADEANQISHETDNQQISDDEMHLDIDDSSLYIDDEYEDQMDLCISDEINQRQDNGDSLLFYPSIASFPDVDIGIPLQLSPRARFTSSSEPELTTRGCHKSLQQRIQKWGSVLRNVWSSNDDLDQPTEMEQRGGRGREGAVTPQ